VRRQGVVPGRYVEVLRGRHMAAAGQVSDGQLTRCASMSLVPPSPPPCRYVFEPAAANREETLKAVKEMRGR
jgi:hypothetical protein